MAIFLMCLIALAALALSWLITCGVLYLIALCFSLSFSWAVATGIWLVMCLCGGIFRTTVEVKR